MSPDKWQMDLSNHVAYSAVHPLNSDTDKNWLATDGDRPDHALGDSFFRNISPMAVGALQGMVFVFDRENNTALIKKRTDIIKSSTDAESMV